MEEVERCPGLWGNLALVGRVHRCVAKPPVSNVTEVIPMRRTLSTPGGPRIRYALIEFPETIRERFLPVASY